MAFATIMIQTAIFEIPRVSLLGLRAPICRPVFLNTFMSSRFQQLSQQQLMLIRTRFSTTVSQKVSAGQASDQRKRREREGHISPQRSPLGTNQSLPSASDTCSEICRSAQQVPIPFWVPEAARSTREEGVERHQKKRAVAGLYLPNGTVNFA